MVLISCFVGFIKNLSDMFDFNSFPQPILQLDHTGGTTRGYHIRADLLDGADLPFKDLLRRIVILHDEGSRSAGATIGIGHLGKIDTGQ